MAAKETEKMTIEQVADALGLSKTTVSRALSGKGRISEETRTKVYAYMGRTRSEPVSAQSGEKLRTNNIAMVVPQRFIALDLPFLRKCMGGICTMADQRGYDLMLCYASNTEYSQLQRQLANHKVDGVMLASMELSYRLATRRSLGTRICRVRSSRMTSKAISSSPQRMQSAFCSSAASSASSVCPADSTPE